MRKMILEIGNCPPAGRAGKLETLFSIFYFLFSILSSSQNIIVTATLDTNAILIGQQAKLKLKAEYKTDQGEIRIAFPKIADTITKQIEVIEKSKIEQVVPDSSDMSHLSMIQILTLTSFDSGYYAIPPFKFIVNEDTNKIYKTEPLLFIVNTVAVDTTQNIKDIKPPIEVPFSWKEFLPYFYWGIGVIAALAGLIYLIIFYLKKRKQKPVSVIIPPKIPPHITALERLKELKEKKLWQQGKVKQYHSELSDIIRQYIEHRFYINAMEQVTDEILYAFRTANIGDELKTKLRQILFLSDMVKFAKEQPLPNENELSWTYAEQFVMDTKPISDSSQREDKNASENNSQRNIKHKVLPFGEDLSGAEHL